LTRSARALLKKCKESRHGNRWQAGCRIVPAAVAAELFFIWQAIVREGLYFYTALIFIERALIYPGSYLYLKGKSVIGQFYTGGECGVHIGVFAQLMADMGKPGVGDAQFLYLFDGLPERKMRNVLFMTQGV